MILINADPWPWSGSICGHQILKALVGMIFGDYIQFLLFRIVNDAHAQGFQYEFYEFLLHEFT